MHDQPDNQWPDQPAKPKSNALGIVGFIFAFCVSPLGLLLSLIALAWRPKGFAIAGVVIGLIGTVLWALGGTALWATRHPFMLGFQHATLSAAIEGYSNAHNGEAPPDLAAAGITGPSAKDPWGRDYKFEPGADGKSWTLTSAAYDGQFGTSDDAVFTNGMDRDAVGKVIEQTARSHFDPNSRRTTPAPAEQPAQKPTESPPAEPKKP